MSNTQWRVTQAAHEVFHGLLDQDVIMLATELPFDGDAGWSHGESDSLVSYVAGGLAQITFKERLEAMVDPARWISTARASGFSHDYVSQDINAIHIRTAGLAICILIGLEDIKEAILSLSKNGVYCMNLHKQRKMLNSIIDRCSKVAQRDELFTSPESVLFAIEIAQNPNITF
jgi:hypothetical protein